MNKISALILVIIVLNGCATLHPTIPEGYSGPIATIQDTENRIDVGKADLFYLSYVDGKAIENSRSATLNASFQKGNNLNTVLLENDVPAQSHVFTIVGRTEYAMPIRAWAGIVYEIKGDVEFTPSADMRYTVKGILSEERSAVWIEDSEGKIVKIIEAEGPSKLGTFEK